MKRPLRELRKGDVFRTADGRLWRRSEPPSGHGGRLWCSALCSAGLAEDLPPGLEVEPLDLPALLSRLAEAEKENADLRAVLHDLWQDRDGAAVAAAERGAVLEALVALLPASINHDQTAVAARVVGLAIDAVKARGPWHPPVPPCALESAVREAVAFLDGHCGSDYPPDRSLPTVAEERALLARLRAALGEANG